MNRFITWLGIAIIITLTFGTIYTTVQQSERQAANDPQIQIAEDAAASLNQGQNPASLTQGNVDISKSLAPFTIVYNKSGKVVSGSGYLNGSVPVAPFGVLVGSKGNLYNYVTWQPASGVRIAAVAVSASNYYVLSGRSLSQIENRETSTLQLAALGWVASIATLCVIYISSKTLSSRTSKKKTSK